MMMMMVMVMMMIVLVLVVMVSLDGHDSDELRVHVLGSALETR